MTARSACRKKPNYKFLHAGRLWESEINFVFCERELFYSHLLRNSTLYCFCQIHKWIWSLVSLVLCAIHSPEQKTKSAKNSLDSMSKLFFNPSECNKLHPPSHLSVRSVLLHFVQRSPPETRTLCKWGKKVNLISGPSKSVSFLGRGEMNGVFIINFVKFIQTRNFFRRGAL